MTDRTDLASPLDQLTPGQTPASSPRHDGANGNATRAPVNPVGTMRIHHRLHPDDTAETPVSQRWHQITIELKGANFRDFLTGTIALAQRPGYMRIDFPPMEQWQSVVSRLPVHVATRIESPKFYQTLQHQITRRVATAPPP